MHLPTCLVCGEKTDDGPTVTEKLRALCAVCWAAWFVDGEAKRWLKQPVPNGETEATMYARAFMDWLNRVRAERRNQVPA